MITNTVSSTESRHCLVLALGTDPAVENVENATISVISTKENEVVTPQKPPGLYELKVGETYTIDICLEGYDKFHATHTVSPGEDPEVYSCVLKKTRVPGQILKGWSLVATPCETTEGHSVDLEVLPPTKVVAEIVKERKYSVSHWRVHSGGKTINITPEQTGATKFTWDTRGVQPGSYIAEVDISLSGVSGQKHAYGELQSDPIQVNARPLAKGDTLPVTMRRAAVAATEDLPLWVVIRKSTEAIGFGNYVSYMDLVLGNDPKAGDTKIFRDLRLQRYLPYNDSDAYRLLKVATEAFLMVQCGAAWQTDGFKDLKFNGVSLDDFMRKIGFDGGNLDIDALWSGYLKPVLNGSANPTVPYLALIREKLKDLRLKKSIFAAENDSNSSEDPYGILREKLLRPCLLELIWSYWHEEGMLVQTMNAITTRFQNIRCAGERDPLAMVEIDPLRPLNNLLWSHIQDEQHRLSLQRRAYEYSHQYGLTLQGKAVPVLRAADSRPKFLEAFHNLLYLCSVFYKQDDDTTVIADGFPVLNALKDVHILLTEGAHNQFGDLPSAARQEMLIQQWLLARPEFREFLPTRIMVAYPEPWMDRVDAMKSLQGWTDSSIIHFRDLGVFGEQILLSIRYGAWSKVDDRDQASNWARFWRDQIQGYTHAYRTVTGVDLTAAITDSQGIAARYAPPSVHLRNRLVMRTQRQKAPV